MISAEAAIARAIAELDRAYTHLLVKYARDIKHEPDALERIDAYRQLLEGDRIEKIEQITDAILSFCSERPTSERHSVH